MKRQPTEGEEIFVNHIFDKGLLSRMYKELLKFISQICILGTVLSLIEGTGECGTWSETRRQSQCSRGEVVRPAPRQWLGIEGGPFREFPGGAVVNKTPRFHFSGRRFDPWSGN